MFLNCVSFQRNFSLLFTWVKGALQLTFNGVFSSRGMGVESTGWGCRGRFPGPPCVSPGRQSGGNVNVTTHLWGGNAVLLYYLACFCCFYSAQAPPLHWRLRAALNDWGKLLNDATILTVAHSPAEPHNEPICFWCGWRWNRALRNELNELLKMH